MPYWRLYYHLVWATRGREPILIEEAEATVCRVIRLVGDELRVHVITVGAMPDHIHVVASIPPSITISEVTKAMKGRTSRLVNHDRGDDALHAFGWQSEYGVLSFGDQALPNVVNYVENQHERHARKDLWSKLERMTGEPSSPRQPSPERTLVG